MATEKKHFIRCLPFALFLLAAIGPMDAADSPIPTAKPVPAMQAVPQPYDQVSIQRDGVEICRYHFGKGLKRPFLFPVAGPSGRSLTRMGHPRDPVGHSHHNSFWIAHHAINGINFWGDQNSGSIRHEKVLALTDGKDQASVAVENGWYDVNGKRIMRSQRTMRFMALPENEMLVILSLVLHADKTDVTLQKTPFGIIGVRMAKTIGVHDGGGMIRNDRGLVNEKAIFRKKTRWVDYSGLIKPDVVEGLTLMDHPSNPNHPAPFHVRNDGWMGACLTLNKAIVIKPGKPLHLHYGLYVHKGLPDKAALESIWQRFGQAALHRNQAEKP